MEINELNEIEDEDVFLSAFLAFIVSRANYAPGDSLEERVSRLLLDCYIGYHIGNDWIVSAAICNSKAILFENHACHRAILVIANTAECFDSMEQYDLRNTYLRSFDSTYGRVIKNLRNRRFHVCVAGHNFAGHVAVHLSQQWGIPRTTFQIPFFSAQYRTSRDYFKDYHPKDTFLGSSNLLEILADISESQFTNFHEVTLDETVTLDQLYDEAAQREQEEETQEEHDDEESPLELNEDDAVVSHSEVQAISRHCTNLDDTDYDFEPQGAPIVDNNEGVNGVDDIPANAEALEPRLPGTVDSMDNARLMPWIDNAREEPQQHAVNEESRRFNHLSTYERAMSKQGTNGNASGTYATPNFTFPNTPAPATTTNPLSHEQLATNALNVQPDGSTLHIEHQSTVTRKKRIMGVRIKRRTEHIQKGVREDRATTLNTAVVNNTNHGPEIVTTANIEVVQHDHTNSNGHVTETLRGRTTTEQKFYTRQNGKEYGQFKKEVKMADGTRINRNEVDQQRSEVKQTTHDAANKAQSTVEIQNVHGTSVTQTVGPTKTNQTKGKFNTVNETVKKQKVVTQKENYTDERARTETNHSTGQSSSSSSDRGEKRQGAGVEYTQKTKTTASKVRAFMTRRTTERTKTAHNYDRTNGNIKYSETKPVIKKVEITEAPADGLKGYFVNEKVKTTTINNEKPFEKKSQDLNPAAQALLAAGTPALLDATVDMIQKYRDKKLSAGVVAQSISKLLVDIGESYFAGHAANLLSTMESHLDALQLSLITVVGGHLLRNGINWFAQPKDGPDAGKSIVKMLPKTEMCIDVAAALAKSGLYYATLGAEFACKSPVIFGATQIISAGQQVLTALLSEKMTLKQALISIAPNVGISLVSTAASFVVQRGVTYCLGAALGGTMAMTALTIVVPAVAFWATRKLLTRIVLNRPEEQELERLLKKYSLKVDADISEIKRVYRKKCLEEHPDKGGSTARFQALNADFDKITGLHMIREAPKQKDAKKKSVFEAACMKMREVIQYFKKMVVKVENVEHVEQRFNQLDSEVKEVAAKVKEIGSIFSVFPSLEQYAKKFEENGYDDLDHLLWIVDIPEEFAALCAACGITTAGHQSQLRVALLKIKNPNPHPEPVNNNNNNTGAGN